MPFIVSKIVGMWKNIDDEDGKEKSHIKKIYRKMERSTPGL